jgi:hypothetical protein
MNESAHTHTKKHTTIVPSLTPTHIQHFLKSTKLSRMFPLVLELVDGSSGNDPDDDDDSSSDDDEGKDETVGGVVSGPLSLDDYFIRVGLVAKAHRACVQLARDIDEGNHKYAAHHLALLFHLAVRVLPKGRAAPFKARIEERF